MIQVYAFSMLAIVGYLLSKSAKIQEVKEPQNISSKQPFPIQGNSDIYKGKQLVEAQKQVKKEVDKRNVRIANNPENFVKPTEKDRNIIYSSLSGEELSKDEFIDKSVMPHFGSSVKQNMNLEKSNPRLEAFTGSNQFHVPKQELEHFGDLTKENGNVRGNPSSYYEFEQSRFVNSHNRTNELPEGLEKTYVGPGLGTDFESKASGGFQQSETLEYAKPKTIDELRVGSNPRNTYEARNVDGLKEELRGDIGDFVKNRVDTFYKNTPDRWLKTTGHIQKDQERPCHVVPVTNRNTTEKNYEGNAFTGKANYVPERYGEARRKVLEPFETRNVTGSENKKEFDYGKQSINLYDNERNKNTCDTYQGNVKAIVDAVIAPITDTLRFTNKEYMVSNARERGNMNVQAPEKMTVYDSSDVTRTTIKETLIHDVVTPNIQLPSKNIVYDPKEIARKTIRETLDNPDTGINLRSYTKSVAYDPDDVARKTMRETTEDQDHMGVLGAEGTELGGYQTADTTLPLTQKQFLSDNDHIGVVGGATTDATGYETAPRDMRMTTKEILSNNDYTGSKGTNPNIEKQMFHDSEFKENRIKELGLIGRDPNEKKSNLFNNSIHMKQNHKLECNSVSTRETQNYNAHNNTIIPGKEFVNSTDNRKAINSNDRLDQSLLNAFKSNPYTHSIDKPPGTY